MQGLRRAAPLLRRAAGSAAARVHYPPPGGAFVAKAHLTTGKAVPEGQTFVTLEEHQKALMDMKLKNKESVTDLEIKFQRSLNEQKLSTKVALVELKCAVKHDGDDKHNKCWLEYANAKNYLKLLREKFESHKLEIENIGTQGTIVKLRSYGWGFGLGTAALTRFTGIPKFFYPKTEGKQ